MPVALAAHHRPGDARGLVGQATATTKLGRRRRSPMIHGSALVAFERKIGAGAVDQQTPQVAVAAFGDAQSS